jgi:hypothetical protein
VLALGDLGSNHFQLAHVLAEPKRLPMKRIICSVTFLALLVAIGYVHAQAVGDPQKGLALA